MAGWGQHLATGSLKKFLILGQACEVGIAPRLGRLSRKAGKAVSLGPHAKREAEDAAWRHLLTCCVLAGDKQQKSLHL